LTPNDQLIPPLLATFMQSLVRCKLKQSALSQVLIQASRPQSIIMPLLFALGVQLGSKFLLQELPRLGFSVSYDEVTRFKMSVMQSHSNNADAETMLPLMSVLLNTLLTILIIMCARSMATIHFMGWA